MSQQQPNRRDLRVAKLGGPESAAEYYARRAAKLMAARRFNLAIVLLQRALELDSDAPKPYIYKAVCELRLNQPTEARRLMAGLARCAVRTHQAESICEYLERKLHSHPGLRQAFYLALIELDRTNAIPFLRLANITAHREDWAEVQRYLLQAFQIKTHDAEVLFGLRQLYKHRQLPECFIHLDRFEEGKLSRADLLALLSGVEHAKEVAESGALGAERGLKEMIEELESELDLKSKESYDSVAPLVKEFTARAEKIVRGDPKARIDMGLAFFEMGLNQPARDQLNQIPTESRLYLEGQCILAEIFLSEGNDLEALAIYQHCLRQDGATAAIQREAEYKLIDIYLRLADVGQALIHFRALQRRQPDYRNLRDLKAKLEVALGTVVESGPTAKVKAGR